MPYTYPPSAPTVTGNYETIHTLLASPTLIARRLRTIAEERFISDVLLRGRFVASGGAVQFEQNESIYTDRAPQSVRPGMGYSQSGLGVGPTQIAEVQKWGQDVPVTDEAIKRLNRNPVDRAFVKLVNQMVRQVDSVSLAAIASSVTTTSAAAAAWSGATAKQILTDVGVPAANLRALNDGYEPDTVVVDDLRWTYAMIAFADAGYVPRETASSNPVLTGQFPVILGMTWLSTPNLPTAGTAMVVDTSQLGGMADEPLGGPGYTGAQAGVESKSIRQDELDRYLLRARRVTVPVVLEPDAAATITGV